MILVLAPLRSNVNFSRIVRAANCCGVGQIIACGQPRIDTKIARVELEQVPLEVRRSLPPVLRKLREDGCQLVGLEQTSNSEDLHVASFARRTALVVGNERQGLAPSVLEMLDRVVEIPVYGMPYSLNVATATAIALYEYRRQYPAG